MNPLLTSTLLMFLAGLAASVPLPQVILIRNIVGTRLGVSGRMCVSGNLAFYRLTHTTNITICHIVTCYRQEEERVICLLPNIGLDQSPTGVLYTPFFTEFFGFVSATITVCLRLRPQSTLARFKNKLTAKWQYSS